MGRRSQPPGERARRERTVAGRGIGSYRGTALARSHGMRWFVLAMCVAVGSCGSCDRESPAPAPAPPPPPKAVAPLRGAAGDADLRVMLAELASSKACTMIKGQFRPLRAPDRRDTVTGILWIRECRIE